MISYLSGKIILKKDRFIIIEVNNIGYKVFLPKQILLRLPGIGENIKVFCFQDVKETALDLYGFLTYEELEFFEILNDIRGVGPKAALEISVVGPLEKIREKILQQDENVFAGIPGVGPKRASTIILELTGKIMATKSASAKASADEAENALVQLGFTKQQVKEALSHLDNSKPTEERIKLALKNLGK
jgi:Holliday junction DNA helicase RuvA